MTSNNNNSYDLFTFSNELFQNCFIDIDFYQWNHHLTPRIEEAISADPLTASTTPSPRKPPASIWIDQPFEIVIKVYPPKGYHGTLDEFQSNWLNALQSLKVDYKLRVHGGTIPCYSKQHNTTSGEEKLEGGPIFDRLIFHSFSRSDAAMVFTYATLISTDAQYLNELLSFDLTLEIILPQDLPFNALLITDSHELKIRMLLDKNRHSPRECPRHALAHPIRLIQPIDIQCSSIELDNLHSLLIVTIANIHEEYAVIVEQILFHLSQTLSDVDKIFDLLPPIYDQSPQPPLSLSQRQLSHSSQMNVPSIRETALTSSGEEVGMGTGTIAQESYSSQQGLYLSAAQQQRQCIMNNQFFQIKALQYEEQYHLLPYQEVRMIYELSIQEDALTATHLQHFLPFGHFRTPMSIYWSPAPSVPLSSSTREVLHASALSWSIGTSMTTNAPSIASSITPSLLKSVAVCAALNQNQSTPTPNHNHPSTVRARALSPAGKSPFDKLVENGLLSLPPFVSAVHEVDSFTFFQMEIEGPRRVTLQEEFSLTLILFNRSSQHSFSDVIVSIDSASALPQSASSSAFSTTADSASSSR